MSGMEEWNCIQKGNWLGKEVPLGEARFGTNLVDFRLTLNALFPPSRASSASCGLLEYGVLL
jgi:hypothetical protein